MTNPNPDCRECRAAAAQAEHYGPAWRCLTHGLVQPGTWDRAEVAALQERLEAAERERNYLRSVVEQLHRDAHDALGETRED